MQNKIEYIKTELPKEWINKQLRKDTAEKITEVETRLNDEYKPLIEAEGLTFDLKLVNSMRKSETAILTQMEQSFKDYIKAVKFIPNAEKKRVETSFLAIAERLDNANSCIFSMLNRYSFDLVENKGRITFNSKQVDEYINSLGVKTFTPLEKEYYKLLDEATEAIIKARNYELKHNLPEYSTKAEHIGISLDGSNKPYSYAAGLSTDAKKGQANLNYIINLQGLKELKEIEDRVNE